MTIKSYLQELERLNVEIKRLSGVLKNLRKQAKQVETNIISYLNEHEQPGVKYNNKAIIIENKIKKKRKTKAQRDNDMMEVLRSYNIPNPEKAMKEILNSKNEETETMKLKFTNFK